MTQSTKRRQYPVVLKSRQYRLVALIMIYSASICAVMFFFLFMPDILQMTDLNASPEMRGFAADRILMLHSRLWPVVLAIICLIGIHSFRMFAVIVGPVARLRWAFEKLLEGDLTVRLNFRKGDYLLEEGALFNQAVERLAHHALEIETANRLAEEALERLKTSVDALGEDTAMPARAVLTDLKAQLDTVDRVLLTCTLRPDDATTERSEDGRGQYRALRAD